MRVTRETRDRLVFTAVGASLGLAFRLATAKAEGSVLAAAGLVLALPASWVHAELPPPSIPDHGDPDPEYVVAPSSAARELHLYDRGPTGWLDLGTLRAEGEAPASRGARLGLAGQGRVRAAAPAYRDLLVGEFRYHLGR